jgi:hypothetical protein
MAGERLDSWQRASVCEVCPAQTLGFGAFDVVDRPGQGRYDPALGYRVDAGTGAAVCVHPYRVGLAPGRYASEGEPLVVPSQVPAPVAAHLELPQDPADLEAWLVARLRVAAPAAMAPTLEEAETIAVERFGSEVVVAALRRVLSVELVDSPG